MITLTTDGSGVAANETLTVETGRRYVFQWGDDIITGPTAGTLTIKSFFQAANRKPAA